MKRLLLVLGLSLAWDLPGLKAAPANSTGSSAVSAPRNSGLAKIFRRGVEAFEQKRFDDAVEAFQQVLQKLPDHLGTKIYLGRTLYQQKNLVDALKVFKDIDIKALEPEAAYDFGQAAYRSADYETALKAFALVPNGHPLYDLAGYYGGISAYKTRDYQHAIDLLDQAVVLPSKLVRSQKLYRLEAEKKLFQKQKEEVQSEGIPIIKGKKELPPTVFVYQPQRGLGITHRYRNQTSEIKKGKAEDYDMQRSTLKLHWSSDKPVATQKSQLIYLTQIEASNVKENQFETLIMPTPRESLENSTLQRYVPDTLVHAEIGGGYEMAIGSTSTIGIIGGAYANAGDGDFAKKILYSPYLSLFLGQSGDALETLLSVETHPRFDKDKLLITQTVQNGSLRFNLSKSVYFGLKGQLNEYSYNTERLSGPDWNGRGQLEVGYERSKTLFLNFGTFYEIAQGWRVYDATQELPLVKFNLAQTGAYTSADLNLTSWWTFGFQAKYAQNNYANVLPELGENFPVAGQTYVDENRPSQLSQFTLYMNFYKSF